MVIILIGAMDLTSWEIRINVNDPRDSKNRQEHNHHSAMIQYVKW